MRRRLNKQILSVVLVLLAALCVCAAAHAAIIDSGTCGAALTWKLDDQGTLTISGTGVMDDYESSGNTAPWGRNVWSVVIEDGVTGIGSYAFFECGSMMSVTIPDSVTSIGNQAFSSRPRFIYTSINSEAAKVLSKEDFLFRVPDTQYDLQYLSETELAVVWADADCTELMLPDEVNRIGEKAFSNCTGLKSITIPNGVTSVGNGAFDKCPAVRHASIDSEAAKALGKAGYSFRVSGTKYDLLCMSDTVLAVTSADADCTEITLPDEVTLVYWKAFRNCTALTKIEMPKVTVIDAEAFAGCSSLKGITIPDGVTSVGYGAFDKCSAVRYASINSEAAKALGKEHYSFRVPDTKYDLEYLSDTVLAVISADADCTELTLPAEVNLVFSRVFSNCSALTKIEMTGVTEILENAFSGCSSLTTLALSNGLTRIRSGAFCDCSGLAGITIPDGVTDIADDAFSGCPAVRYASLGSEAAKALSRASYSFRVSGTQYDLEYTFRDSEVSGLNLVSVDRNAAAITVPPEVTGVYAADGQLPFSGCTSLKSITMNTGITYSDTRFFIDCFDGCTSLEEIVFPEDHTTCCSVEGVVFSKDQRKIIYCPKGKTGEYAIPDTISDLQNHVFTNCSALTGITVPDSVMYMENSVFEGCSGLVSAKIDARYTGIYFRSLFSGCNSLTNVTISEDHDTYCSMDGIVFSKDRKTLVYFPRGKEGDYSVSEGVSAIDSFAFSECTDLKAISLPDSLVTVDSCAFLNCSAQGSIVMPPWTESIGDNAFRGCMSLKSVTMYENVTSIGTNAFEKTTVIMAPQDSYAAKWASENGYELRCIETILRTVTVSGDGHGMAAADPSSGPEGTEVTLTATPDEGYQFKEWIVTAGGVEIKDNRFTIGSAHVEIQAVFEELPPNEYSIIVSTNGNGTASANPSSGPEGTEVTLTATPNKGYQFKEWVVIAGGVEIKNNRFTIGSANVEIRAVFEPITVRTSIAKAKVTVKDQVYTGKAIKPKVTVKLKKKTLAAGTDYKLTFKNNKAIGTATVTVTGKGAYTGKIQATFKINPKAVALSSLEAGSQKLTVKWKKSSGITGYEIQYGLKKNFKDAKTVTIKKAKTTSMKIGKLKKGKTYYVRIRVYKTVKGTKYYSAWSKALKQKVK